MKTIKALTPILIAAILLVLLSSTVALAQVGRGWFKVDKLWADSDAYITGSATVATDLNVIGNQAVGGNQTVAGTSATTGNASFAGTVAVNGSDLAVAKMLALTPQTAITATDGGIITPTGTIQMLAAAGAVTPTIAAGSSGDVVTFINTSNAAITIVDTTGYLLSGNIVMGQWDSATVVWYGTSWIQVAESDN